MSLRHAFAAVMLFAASTAMPHVVRAAESYDNCAGFIDTVPTTISTQGVWCLRHDLSTNIASGNAITIATNNVTIDCNDFKIGGLAAGSGSKTNGIYAVDRQNATVRNCNVRGFYRGVGLYGGAGHLVEENRLDNNLYVGISVLALDTGSIVRRNRVFDTGGTPLGPFIYGISGNSDVVDNIVAGVGVTQATSFGIFNGGNGAQVSGNVVSKLGLGRVEGTGVECYGIYLQGDNDIVSDNRLVGGRCESLDWGLYLDDESMTKRAACAGNTFGNFATAIGGTFTNNRCVVPASDDNLVYP